LWLRAQPSGIFQLLTADYSASLHQSHADQVSKGNPRPTKIVTTGRRTIQICIRCRILIPLAVLLVFGSVNSLAEKHKATTSRPPLLRAEAVLNDLARNPQDAIPDSVLNHTQCVLVFPNEGAAPAVLHGIASCRQAAQEWKRPGAVTLVGSPPAQRADFLIFLLNSSAPTALQSGNFKLPSATAGPLVRISSVVAPVEIRSDAVAYARAGAQLKGVALGGSIHAESGQKWSEPQTRKYSAALVSFFNTIVPSGIIIHHTATLPTNGRVPASEREVDQYHQARGFNVLCLGKEYHVAYHYLVLPDGKIQQGRPERCEGAHALGYNSYLGISVAGDFSSSDNQRGLKGVSRLSASQIKSVIQLCRKLRREYHIPLQHILRHSDVAPTECPGDKFPFRYVVSQLASRE
jgi:N-acetylmuramoyl-L-alanine amidase